MSVESELTGVRTWVEVQHSLGRPSVVASHLAFFDALSLLESLTASYAEALHYLDADIAQCEWNPVGYREELLSVPQLLLECVERLRFAEGVVVRAFPT